MSMISRKSNFMVALLSASSLAFPAMAQTTPDVTFEQATGIQSEKAAKHADSPLAEALQGEPQWLNDVYGDMDYAYVWSGRFTRASSEFKQFQRFLRRMSADGIPYADYYQQRVADLRRADPETREIETSKIFARLARELRHGVSSPEIDLPDEMWIDSKDKQMSVLLAEAYQHRNPVNLLDDALEDNFVVDNLLVALERYRGYREEGGWEAIAFDERKIEVGDIDEDIPQVRERLKAEGFYTGLSPEDPQLYDEALASAVESFQASRSMSVDGIIGPNTITALNESVDDLIRRIELNIDRARWLPEEMGDRAVFVNIADYTLRLLDDDRIVDRIDVVVGAINNKTPAFADEMETIVTNPYWNIPSSITIGEIAPAMLRDPSYVSGKNMEVITASGIVSPNSVDWNAAANGDLNFRVRQRPGPGNALGQVKFLFPNKYAVYLHDTPSKSLFEEDRRAASHGCIRVGDPARLAEFIARAQPDMDDHDVARAIRSGERVEFTLKKKVPVYLTYFTAWAEEDGSVVFPRDIYDRDVRIAGQLSKQT